MLSRLLLALELFPKSHDVDDDDGDDDDDNSVYEKSYRDDAVGFCYSLLLSKCPLFRHGGSGGE